MTTPRLRSKPWPGEARSGSSRANAASRGTTALLVARMGSRRLPGKSMLPIVDKPMIAWMIERIAKARAIHQIVLATTDRAEDDPLARLAGRLGIACYRGPADDVLARVCGAARAYGADPVVELLGDNPFVHGSLIDDVVEFFRHGGYDYAATVTTEYPLADPALKKFPVGIRVQVISAAALKRCHQMAQDPTLREHSTACIYHHPEHFRIGYYEAVGRWATLNRPELTFAVNYRENFEMVTRIVEHCALKGGDVTLQDALQVFDASPQLHQLMGVPRALASV